MSDKKNCKCSTFYGYQKVYLNEESDSWGVVVDANGNFLHNIEEHEEIVEMAENPEGPFTCTQCDTEYEELPIKTSPLFTKQILSVIIEAESEEEAKEKLRDMTKDEIIKLMKLTSHC